MLNNYIKDEIRKHAAEFPTEEVCGFILDNNTIFRARNISMLKNKTFSIHPIDYATAELNHKIVAVYHSHITNNDNFSEFDKINSSNHHKTFVMYCLKKDTFNTIYPNVYSNKYIGINFNYETHNCATLIIDFYKNELNIILKMLDIKIDEKWYENHSRIMIDTWKELNPELIEVQEARKHDIIFFNYIDKTKEPHHVGMYFEEGLFLHHPRAGLSRLEIFDDLYQKKVTHILRHKSLR